MWDKFSWKSAALLWATFHRNLHPGLENISYFLRDRKVTAGLAVTYVLLLRLFQPSCLFAFHIYMQILCNPCLCFFDLWISPYWL